MNESRPESMSSFWMPFTNNRDFKANPRLLVSAEGMYYKDVDGNQVLDGTAGLWCVQCGHAPAEDHRGGAARWSASWTSRPPSRWATRPPSSLAEQLMDYTGHGFDHVFFTNSGSEAVDTALKIALAYHRARGEGARTRLIGRERGYHGVGFGGMSVGGIGANRKHVRPAAARRRPPAAHPRPGEATPSRAASRSTAPHLADELERIVALHDASTIAAVIVEPVAGSTGVLVPPKGYLKRLREICAPSTASC